jgi:hypothetical protein
MLFQEKRIKTYRCCLDFMVFFSRLTGGKSPPLVIFHESSLAGPCSYNRYGEIHGDTREKKTKKYRKKAN